MEGRFGHSFAQVRVHGGPIVQRAGMALRARAYTLGTHIGWPQPVSEAHSTASLQLLAHELAHVVQQQGPRQAAVQDRRLEAEAEGAARATGEERPPRLSTGQAEHLACSLDEWLHTTPDLRSRSDTEIDDDIDQIEEWLARQTSTSDDSIALERGLGLLRDELGRRNRSIAKSARARPKRAPPQRKAPAEQPVSPMPRVLAERSSRQLEDGDELRDEVDRITAWLRRGDLTRPDREVLEVTLANLSPAYADERARRRGQRQADLVHRALSAGTELADARANLLAHVARIDSIAALPGEPGVSYLMLGSEIVRMDSAKVARLRERLMQDFDTAAARIHGITERVQADWEDMRTHNYDDQYIVGFLVSTWNGESAMDIHERLMVHVVDSNNSLSRYRKARSHGTALRPMAAALADAAGQADRSRETFDSGRDRLYGAAGDILSGLVIIREVGMLAGMALTAGLAAPAVAGVVGVSGLGATGLVATGATAVGTSTVVAGTGAVMRGAPALAGGLLAGQDAGEAFRHARSEAYTGARQGAALGLGAGAAVGVGRALGVGSTTLSRSQQFGRAAVAQGSGNFLASTGSALAEGKEAGDALKAGALSVPLSLLGTGLNQATGSLRSPVLMHGVQAAGNTAIGAGGAAMAGGTRDEILMGGALGLTGWLSGGALNPHAQVAHRLGAGWGRSTRMSALGKARALTLGVHLGTSDALPVASGLRSASPMLPLAGPAGRVSGLSEPASSAPLTQPRQPGRPGAAVPATRTDARRPLPPDVADEFVDRLFSAENPFTLDISARRAARIASGEKNFRLDHPITFDFDEPLAVGAASKPQRAVARALDPHNRELKDPRTNRDTKHVLEDPRDIGRGRERRSPISVADDPEALFTRRFDEITEMRQVFDEAVARTGSPGRLKPTALKDAINRNIRDIIGNGRSPAGIAVRDALHRLGFERVPGQGLTAVRQAPESSP
jgi:hypothetical protein